MREIGFRIYDKEKNKMIYSGYTPSMLSGFFHQTAVLNTRDEMEYQQDTGLKDKNGKMIFEGDIIKIGTVQIREMSDPNPYLRIVCWEENKPTLDYKQIDGRASSGLTFCKSNCEDFEIIGNKWENPELMEVK